MRAVVVYESMFGATRAVAEAIAAGLSDAAEVRTVRVADAERDMMADADLVVVGGPTHVHARSRPRTRRGARDYIKPGKDLALEPGADIGPGVRDLEPLLQGLGSRGAAFDTRVSAPAALTGRASKGIARELQQAGLDLVVEPESFLVDKDSHLVEGELERAREWGRALASRMEVHHVG